jgi:ribonuclease PH
LCTAATLALVDVSVELLDSETSCIVAVMVQQHGRSITDNKSHDYDDMDSKVSYLVDPVEEEILAAQTIICLAMTPNHKEITLWNQSGKLSGTMVFRCYESLSRCMSDLSRVSTRILDRQCNNMDACISKKKLARLFRLYISFLDCGLLRIPNLSMSFLKQLLISQ